MNKIKNIFKNVFSSFSKITKKTLGVVTRIDYSYIRKIVGFLLAVVGTIVLIFETIFILLISVDPGHFMNILHSKFGFYLADFISPIEYYAIVLGGYILDVVFISLVIILGTWLYTKKCALKNKNALYLLVFSFAFGASIFSAGLFYALPEIKKPLEIVKDQIHKDCQKKHAAKMQKKMGKMVQEQKIKEYFFDREMRMKQKYFMSDMERDFHKAFNRR